MNYQSHLRQLCLVLLQFFVFSFSILLIARGVFFHHIQDVLIQPGVTEDIWRAFRVGARFDAKVTAIAYAPLLLAGLVLAASRRGYARWCHVAPLYHALIALLYVLGCIGNYYYYLTYGTHIDLFMFGLWEDDSKAVLVNIWQDYPILRALLLALSFSVLAYVTARWFMRSAFGRLKCKHSWHWSVTSLAVLCVVLVTFAVARGSLSSHPLKRYHAAVSPYKPLNMITPNVFMALDWAMTDYKEQHNFAPVSQAELTAQMNKILGQPTPQYRTPANDYLQQHPPHVVVAMMESMGMNILVEDDAKTNDLLGSFRQYRDQGFWFERFMAGTSATIDSIVMTLFHSPVATISHSAVQNIALPSSAALPYKRAGYEVVFLYGGNGMWRNLANYLPVQGFDRVYDENDIMEAFPESEQYAGPWGVPDGYLFKFANRVLEQAEKPIMMFIMTVTNHSPYKVPEYYQPAPTRMSERLAHLIGYQGEQASVLLQTFQYASDALGQFIGRIKQSDKLKDNTVIAVTGDHRMRYSSTDEPEEFAMTYAVPFYLNVPQPILANTRYEFDAQRVGSHRDLFPTLYHFSLSDQDYISLGGENMLAEQDVSRFGYNATRSINQYGAFSTQGNGLYYPWQASSPLRNQAMPVSDVPFDAEWAKEYHLLQDYYLRSQVVPMVQ
ncbi:LTA synthase family protein [Vibrio ostreae]|uniref:LTA synthase family protein n=1 Tax=Vibrio ostreae TaxID=2841925 RepID=A0A975YN10_9VIBR|nr:LTA synthase family protein [Vibrio ostreae]QXO17268.1 LTA synthase family protein [Vibrio ostreae]